MKENKTTSIEFYITAELDGKKVYFNADQDLGIGWWKTGIQYTDRIQVWNIFNQLKNKEILKQFDATNITLHKRKTVSVVTEKVLDKSE